MANDTTRTGVPALKVTTPAGRSSILIGSVHIGLEGLRQPNGSAFEGVKRYVVEQVSGEGPPAKKRELWPAALAEYLKTRRWIRAPWAEQLSTAEIGELKRRLVCNGVPFAQAEGAIDALLAMDSPLTVSEVAIRRCAPGGLLSRDEVLAGYARQRGIPISSLEVNAEVEVRRRNVPDRIYLHDIHVAMTDRQLQALHLTAQAHNQGDNDAINPEIHELAANQEDAALYDRLMVASRNEAWMPLLTKYLDDGDAFVNVGAAHLPGPKGLVALLLAAGMKVESILLPAALPQN